MMIKKLATMMVLTFGMIGVFSFVSTASVSAVSLIDGACNKAGGTSTDNPVCQASQKDKVPGLVQKIINLALWAIGALSVIMIVVGGIKYTISNGNQENITKAKNTIMYAVVGLAVALLGQAIVLLVVNFLV